MYFNKDYLDDFLATVRKYMQLRGGLTQKDLSETTNVGISSMSRFLNQKTKDLDEQLIANIVATLNIPLHEIIDFIEEEYTPKFKKLVSFYKDEEHADRNQDREEAEEGNDPLDDLDDVLGTARSSTTAKVRVGGRENTIHFGSEARRNGDMSVKEKLSRLSPRQKAYLTDFLELDVEGRDLIVDVGNSLFRYFKQRGLEF